MDDLYTLGLDDISCAGVYVCKLIKLRLGLIFNLVIYICIYVYMYV